MVTGIWGGLKVVGKGEGRGAEEEVSEDKRKIWI
jgi:hypothetical protein